MRAAEFAALSCLVAGVSVRMIHPSDNPVQIEERCRFIVEDFKAQET
jgi:hypothetical protein